MSEMRRDVCYRMEDESGEAFGGVESVEMSENETIDVMIERIKRRERRGDVEVSVFKEEEEEEEEEEEVCVVY
jgi:hypothetical protein